MSKTENTAVELERKFLISQKTALQLISEFEESGLLAKKIRIQQNYLFKENAKLKYDIESDEWVVKLKVNKQSETFRFKETKNPETAREVLSQYSGKNLLGTKCAARIRIMDDEPIFTFKRPLDTGKGDSEFEDNIKEVVGNSSLFNEFIESDLYKVLKTRFVINRQSFNYEIDFFDDVDLSTRNPDLDISSLDSVDLCLLEVEFETEAEYDNFKTDFEGIDVSEIKGFGNKKMAKELGENKKKSKNRKHLI